MATPQLSPGVLVREVDLTVGRADNVLDNIGAIAGPFEIGPVEEVTNITTEQDLINVFGEPKTADAQYEYWMSASSYLSYGGVLKVIRADDDDLKSANAGVGIASTSLKIKNYDDYVNNEWDKGHLAPAAAFNCDKETLKKTFSYLNCALQHEGLNRGPWKELEEFERGLAKISDDVMVHIIVVFSELPSTVPGGATIPSAFIKEITFNGIVYSFLFPNENVSGQDWGTFNMYSPND